MPLSRKSLQKTAKKPTHGESRTSLSSLTTSFMSPKSLPAQLIKLSCVTHAVMITFLVATGLKSKKLLSQQTLSYRAQKNVIGPIEEEN